MRATSVAEVIPIKLALRAAFLLSLFFQNSPAPAAGPHPDESFAAAHKAYNASDYPKALELLQIAAQEHPGNPEIHLLLAKTYYESHQHDAAIASAERAVALAPQSSLYHEWLGKVYGEKADHAAMFSALSLARKARKEFEKAVDLDANNFAAHQALIEFDCTAPGIAGGGEDKARPEIARLAALDPAEGHYAAGNCHRQKKNFAAADSEFAQALELHPKSAELIYDIGDYAMKQGQPQTLAVVAEQGRAVAPSDPRAKFYRAVAFIIKNDSPLDSERLLRQYLQQAPLRSGFPPPWRVHEWLGRLYENQEKSQAAILEYETTLQLEPKDKFAREALKRLKKG